MPNPTFTGLSETDAARLMEGNMGFVAYVASDRPRDERTALGQSLGMVVGGTSQKSATSPAGVRALVIYDVAMSALTPRAGAPRSSIAFVPDTKLGALPTASAEHV